MRLDSRWERLTLAANPLNARALLVVVGIVAMLLGGAADWRWN